MSILCKQLQLHRTAATESELYFSVHTAVNVVALAVPNAAAIQVNSLLYKMPGVRDIRYVVVRQ